MMINVYIRFKKIQKGNKGYHNYKINNSTKLA